MLTEQVQTYIEAHGLLPAGAAVVVGLSGGVDSVTLTHVLRELGYAVRAGHVNYRLRGEASEADEALVRRFCRDRDVPLEAVRYDTGAEAARRGTSVQAAARALRYAFLREMAEREGAAHVTVAHHRDDQAETLLLNLLRGSGVEGLAGMPPARPLRRGAGVQLVRPLLGIRREAIEAYAREHALPWREDATNTSPKYRRGALRSAVLPVLREHFGPGVSENTARSAELVRAYVEENVQPELAARFAEAGEAEEEGGTLRREALRRAPDVWRHRLVLEALRRWLPEAPRNAAVAEEIGQLVEAQVGRRVELKGGAVWRERGTLRFVPETDEAGAGPAHRLARGGCVMLPGSRLCAQAPERRPERLDDGHPHTAVLDADRLRFPLRVRPWQPGDRLRPLGMDGHKSVADLLTDAKVPPHRRAQVHVVCSGETVVWVVGHRLAAEARVRPETERFVRLAYFLRRGERETGRQGD